MAVGNFVHPLLYRGGSLRGSKGLFSFSYGFFSFFSFFFGYHRATLALISVKQISKFMKIQMFFLLLFFWGYICFYKNCSTVILVVVSLVAGSWEWEISKVLKTFQKYLIRMHNKTTHQSCHS